MNKQLANIGSTLNKNMTNTESLQLDNITVTHNISIPVLTSPLTPLNPVEGSLYIKKDLTAQVQYEMMFYIDGSWR